MSNKEIIILLKKDCQMNDRDWLRFCKRYHTRDLRTVIAAIKEAHPNIIIPPHFSDFLRKEMQSEVANSLAAGKRKT